jgi:hypothetical protein
MRHETCLACLYAPDPVLHPLTVIAETVSPQVHHHHAMVCEDCGAWWFDDTIIGGLGILVPARRDTMLCGCPDDTAARYTRSVITVPRAGVRLPLHGERCRHPQSADPDRRRPSVTGQPGQQSMQAAAGDLSYWVRTGLAAGVDVQEIARAWYEAQPDRLPPEVERAADRWLAHYWPMAHFKVHGIERGRQYHVLGWLAARYARDFTTDELACELWEVIEASGQGRPRWTYRQITATAARAMRFIDREDAALRDSGAMAWALADRAARTGGPPPQAAARWRAYVQARRTR